MVLCRTDLASGGLRPVHVPVKRLSLRQRTRLQLPIKQLALLCFAAILFSFSAFAQVGAGGTIVGTVTDPSGAAVPNAPIAITNLDTNTVTRATSNASGEYTAGGLPVGRYTVAAEVSGFKKAQEANIPLNVGDRRTVDIKLEIGSTSESVVVQADAVQVQSESGEVSDVITGQQVTQLATNGRSLYALTALIPGSSSNMSDFQSPTPVGGNSNVSFNGLRVSHNLYMIDGGEDLDRGGSGNISVMPSIDAIGEFRALTSNYSAEFGLASGATMTMVFKSGTKDFHGELWEFCRNDALDANNFFNNQAGVPAPGTSAKHLRLQYRRPGIHPEGLQQKPRKNILLLQHGMAQDRPRRLA